MRRGADRGRGATGKASGGGGRGRVVADGARSGGLLVVVFGHLVGGGEVLDGDAGVGERAGDVGGAVDPEDLHRLGGAGVAEAVHDAGLDVGGVVGHKRGDLAVDLHFGRAC